MLPTGAPGEVNELVDLRIGHRGSFANDHSGFHLRRRGVAGGVAGDPVLHGINPEEHLVPRLGGAHQSPGFIPKTGDAALDGAKEGYRGEVPRRVGRILHKAAAEQE